MNISLKGKIAVITGGAQGIGSAIAEHFLESGAKVVILDLKDIKKKDRNVTSFIVDIRKQSMVQKSINSILKKYKKIDIIVNNAGIIRDGFISQLNEKDWDQVLDTNLKGAFLLCQAVIPSMKERKYGKIVNIISRSWLGNIGQSNYSASKGGLVSLTRTLALELARFNINVNAVSPGLIDTPMTRGLPSKVRNRLIQMQPTGKMGTPRDIASAVEFLASDKAIFISGQVLHVDGGKSVGLLSL